MRLAPKPLAALFLSLGLALSPLALATSDLVISQLYGGGGNSGATLKNDYVELFNRGSAPLSLAGRSIQYTSATGTGNFGANSSLIVVLPGVTLQPGQYFLAQLAAGSGGTEALPTPDVTGSINMSGTAGKLALVNDTVGLGCNGSSTPCSTEQAAKIADLVGFGNANYFEGSAPAPTLSNTLAGFRAAAGCQDTDNNAADFASAAPAPRNTASALNACTPVGNAPIVPVCPTLQVIAGEGGSGVLTASDADSRVDAASLTGTPVAGLSLGAISPALADGDSASVSLQVAASVPAGSYTAEIRFDNNEAQSASCQTQITVTALTPIPVIQGSGNASPLAGQLVTTQGVVTKLIPGNGYVIQDAQGDGDPLTSDGLFVFFSGTLPASIAPGNLIRVSGKVTEFNTLTELTSPTGVVLLDSGLSLAPVEVAFPEHVEGDLEQVENMLIRISTPLTVVQNFFQGRYGEVSLAADGRLIKPTNLYPANSAEALALADENARRRITLDDGNNQQNPNPIPYIGEDNTLRAGDTVPGLTGVLYHGSISSSLRDYKLHPTEAVTFNRVNARSAAPDEVGGNLTAASFNVLNFFTTIDQEGAQCAPSMTRSDCRGADSVEEFTRQRDKLLAALTAINADVVGLIELENNGNTAVQNLVDGLNERLGAGTYASIGLPVGGTGSDAIRLGFIYKPARVLPLGDAVSDTDPVHNRPPLAQTFIAPNGEVFSAIVNHFKSKGSCPSDPADPNADQGDGQGCWNALRIEQASRLLGFSASVQGSAGDEDVLFLGDLNSYGMEDPIRTLIAGGFADQIARFNAQGYSYVFDAESGYLDHALANAPLASQLTGVSEWHINADEPSVIDYNTEFKTQDLYSASPYRASDHDPVVVGLNVVNAIDGGRGFQRLIGTPGDDVLTGGFGPDLLIGNGGNDVFRYLSLRDAYDLIADFLPGSDRVDLAPVLAALGYTGTQGLAEGWVRLQDSPRGTVIDVNPRAGNPGLPATWQPLTLLRGVQAAQIDGARDLGQ